MLNESFPEELFEIPLLLMENMLSSFTIKESQPIFTRLLVLFLGTLLMMGSY